MLPKDRRIPRGEFSHILSSGKRLNSQRLLIYIANNPISTTTKTKVSFSLSKKVCPKASDRNKYRRQGYSIISKNMGKMKEGFLIFFSFKKASIPVNFSDLESEVLRLLSDSGVIR